MDFMSDGLQELKQIINNPNYRPQTPQEKAEELNAIARQHMKDRVLRMQKLRTRCGGCGGF